MNEKRSKKVTKDKKSINAFIDANAFVDAQKAKGILAFLYNKDSNKLTTKCKDIDGYDIYTFFRMIFKDKEFKMGAEIALLHPTPLWKLLKYTSSTKEKQRQR